jgi:hypothetical protein
MATLTAQKHRRNRNYLPWGGIVYKPVTRREGGTMPTYDIDLTTADVLPDGNYVVTIKKAEVKPTKDGASQIVSWQLQVNQPEQFAGRMMFEITSFKVPFRIKQFMDAAKAPYDKTGFDPELTVGKQINVEVGIEDDPNYGARNRVNKAWAI